MVKMNMFVVQRKPTSNIRFQANINQQIKSKLNKRLPKKTKTNKQTEQKKEKNNHLLQNE